MKLGKLNWSNTAYSDVLSIRTHSNQWDAKCHNLWIISMRFNTALDSCSIYDQFIAVYRRSSKVRACCRKAYFHRQYLLSETEACI